MVRRTGFRISYCILAAIEREITRSSDRAQTVAREDGESFTRRSARDDRTRITQSADDKAQLSRTRVADSCDEAPLKIGLASALPNQ